MLIGLVHLSVEGVTTCVVNLPPLNPLSSLRLADDNHPQSAAFYRLPCFPLRCGGTLEQGEMMDDSSKVALGIMGAAVVLAVAFIGYREFDRQRDIAAMNEALAEFSKPDPFGLEAEHQQAQHQQAQRRAQVRAVDVQRRQLTGDQRCVGGVVVVVSGSSYSQLGSVGDPVRCSGQLADRPIR